jgi:membrane protein
MDVAQLPWWKRTFEILKAAGKEFGEDNAGRKAAALSYYTIFSLVPLLFIVVAVVGFVSRAQAVSPGQSYTDQLVQYVTDIAGATVGEQIASIVDSVEQQAGSSLSIGIVLAVFSASTIFLQIQGVLGIIFQVPDHKKRKGIVGMLIQRGIGASAVITLAVLALAPIVAVAAVNLVPDSWGAVRTVARFLVPVLAVLMLMAIVGLTFQYMTAIVIPWKSAVRGGAATAIIGLVAAYLVGLYLAGQSGGGVSAMGVLGGAVILLFFFNLMWNVYLLGAEVTKVYGDYLEFGDVVQPSERTARQHQDHASVHPISRSQPGADSEEPTAKVGVTAFVLGALFGWLGGRKR